MDVWGARIDVVATKAQPKILWNQYTSVTAALRQVISRSGYLQPIMVCIKPDEIIAFSGTFQPVTYGTRSICRFHKLRSAIIELGEVTNIMPWIKILETLFTRC